MKRIALFLFCCLAAAIYAAEFTGVHKSIPAGTLQITQIYQGEVVGDSYIIRLPDERIVVVDGGDVSVTENYLMPAIDKLGIKEIDTVIVTHFHSDHVGGVIALLADPEISVRKLLYTTMPYDEIGSIFSIRLTRQVIRIAEMSGIPVRNLKVGDNLDFGSGVSAEVIGTALTGSKDKNLNSHSLVFRLKYGDFTALFTGDCSLQQEPRLFESSLPMKSDLLKMPHHAGANSTSDRLLDTVAPQVAISSMPIWLSRDDRGRRVEKMLKARKITFFRSWEYPDLVIFSDGKTFGAYSAEKK